MVDPPWLLLPTRINLYMTQSAFTRPITNRNQCVEYIEENYSHRTRIYTDGEKSELKCGCAFFVEMLDYSKIVPLL